ncbi:hypothetical protein FSP39_006782 [Pinctada imbricata]|uniref:HAUS augmin-like complex subunit 4 n=1 Tax=Pinctada imbricata TaxID=66713 RepID=A0AA88XQM7_PINIB|nr:hypothetical protein FSP39_006782 [Pinctada imbricata]
MRVNQSSFRDKLNYVQLSRGDVFFLCLCLTKVKEAFPVEFSEECMHQNPEFVKLLNELSQHVCPTGVSKQVQTDLHQVSQHVCPSGVSKQVQSDLHQAEKELRYEKHPWLMNHILYTELEKLLLEAEIEVLEGAEPQHELEKLLLEAEIEVLEGAEPQHGKQFYSMLQDHFTTIKTGDYLNCCPDPGSKVRLLGLTPEVILEQNTHMQNLPYIEQKLIPLIEEQLSKKCDKLLDYYNSTHDDIGSDLTVGQGSQLPNVIEVYRQKIDDEREQLKKELRRQDAQFKAYYATLLDSMHLLEELVSKYRLRNQSQHDSVMAEWMMMKFDGFCLKIRVLELEIMIETYTFETTKALQKIRDHLDVALAEATKKRTQLQKLLETYQSVGMGFDDLVKEYGRLKEEVENKQWALSELKQSESSADGQT